METMKDREIVKNDLNLLRDLTLRSLYEDKCPIELYEEVSRYYGHPDFDNLLIGTEDDLSDYAPECIKKPHKWFIDNGYIGEIEEDIELRPGMILRNDTGREYFVLEDGRLYYGKGWSLLEGRAKEIFKSLDKLNYGLYKENYFSIVKF